MHLESYILVILKIVSYSIVARNYKFDIVWLQIILQIEEKGRGTELSSLISIYKINFGYFDKDGGSRRAVTKEMIFDGQQEPKRDV